MEMSAISLRLFPKDKIKKDKRSAADIIPGRPSSRLTNENTETKDKKENINRWLRSHLKGMLCLVPHLMIDEKKQ